MLFTLSHNIRSILEVEWLRWLIVSCVRNGRNLDDSHIDIHDRHSCNCVCRERIRRCLELTGYFNKPYLPPIFVKHTFKVQPITVRVIGWGEINTVIVMIMKIVMVIILIITIVQLMIMVTIIVIIIMVIAIVKVMVT